MAGFPRDCFPLLEEAAGRFCPSGEAKAEAIGSNEIKGESAGGRGRRQTMKIRPLFEIEAAKTQNTGPMSIRPNSLTRLDRAPTVRIW